MRHCLWVIRKTGLYEKKKEKSRGKTFFKHLIIKSDRRWLSFRGGIYDFGDPFTKVGKPIGGAREIS